MSRRRNYRRRPATACPRISSTRFLTSSDRRGTPARRLTCCGSKSPYRTACSSFSLAVPRWPRFRPNIESQCASSVAGRIASARIPSSIGLIPRSDSQTSRQSFLRRPAGVTTWKRRACVCRTADIYKKNRRATAESLTVLRAAMVSAGEVVKKSGERRNRVARPSRQGGRVAQRQEAAPCGFARHGTSYLPPTFMRSDPPRRYVSTNRTRMALPLVATRPGRCCAHGRATR